MSPMTARSSADLHRAWWSLVAFIPAFFLAFGVGEGLAALLGHPPGTSGAAPIWVMVVCGVPALAVFALPGLAAWHYGRRAARGGLAFGNVPAWLGLVLAAGFAATNAMAAFIPGA